MGNNYIDFFIEIKKLNGPQHCPHTQTQTCISNGLQLNAWPLNCTSSHTSIGGTDKTETFFCEEHNKL